MIHTVALGNTTSTVHSGWTAIVRKKAGGALFKWAGNANVKLDPDLTHTIEQGFPDGD
jgi:hypothetical protein